MRSNLHYNAVSPLLLKILKILIKAKEFEDFRLAGGTALCLYRGHRESVDIDLFTDAQYGSIDKMLALHKQRNPYTHDGDQIRRNFSNFENADDDFDQVCLKGKHWEIIKLDIIDFAGEDHLLEYYRKPDSTTKKKIPVCIFAEKLVLEKRKRGRKGERERWRKERVYVSECHNP